MRNGYPTEEELAFVRDYDVLKSGALGLIEHLQEIWAYEDYVKYEKGILEIHTGGWSGNESIIEVLEHTYFWFFYWMKSERGGHYYFEIPAWAEKGKP